MAQPKVELVRSAIVEALQDPGRFMLQPQPGDVLVAPVRRRPSAPPDWTRVLLAVLALSLVLSSSWIAGATGLPLSIVSVVLSIVAAYIVARHAI